MQKYNMHMSVWCMGAYKFTLEGKTPLAYLNIAVRGKSDLNLNYRQTTDRLTRGPFTKLKPTAAAAPLAPAIARRLSLYAMAAVLHIGINMLLQATSQRQRMSWCRQHVK